MKKIDENLFKYFLKPKSGAITLMSCGFLALSPITDGPRETSVSCVGLRAWELQKSFKLSQSDTLDGA